MTTIPPNDTPEGSDTPQTPVNSATLATQTTNEAAISVLDTPSLEIKDQASLIVLIKQNFKDISDIEKSIESQQKNMNHLHHIRDRLREEYSVMDRRGYWHQGNYRSKDQAYQSEYETIKQKRDELNANKVATENNFSVFITRARKCLGYEKTKEAVISYLSEKQDYQIYQHLPEEFRSDMDIILETSRIHNMDYGKTRTQLKGSDLATGLRGHLGVVGKYNRSVIKFIPKDFFADKNNVLQLIKEVGSHTHDEIVRRAIPKDFFKDDEFVSELIKHIGYREALYHISPELKSYRKIAFECVKLGEKVLVFLSADLKKDPEFVLTEVQAQVQNASIDIEKYMRINSHLFHGIEEGKSIPNQLKEKGRLNRLFTLGPTWYKLPEELKNKEFMMKLVGLYGGLFGQVQGTELANDRELALLAIQDEPEVLKYASDELKNDKELVLLAIKKNILAFFYASDELKNDKELALMILEENGLMLECFSDKLKKDKDVVLEAVASNGQALHFANVRFLADDGILRVAKANGYTEEKPESLKKQLLTI